MIQALSDKKSAEISTSRLVMKKLLKIAGVFLSVLLIWSLYTQWKIADAGGSKRLDAPADVGIVLGASLWGDEPSPGLKERLNLVIEQYQAGRFQDIIVTGGYDTPQSTVSEAEGSKRYLVQQGIPENHIWLEDQSTSTLENLQNAQEIMKKQDWHTATIMTHNFHGTRAREIAEALNFDDIEIFTVKSKVLSPVYHPVRETLAYTKWKWDKLWL